NIKGPAAQIVDHYSPPGAVAESISEAGCCRFIEDANHFKSGHHPRFAGSSALGVGKIGGYGDDGAANPLIQLVTRPLCQFAQNQRRNLLWAEDFVSQGYVFQTAH